MVSTLSDTEESLKIFASTSPARIQEGDNTNITIEIRRATPNKAYTFRINVSNPAGNFSARDVTVVTDMIGSGSNSTEYLGAFTDANTDYVGTYSVAVKNVTTNETLVTTSFTVGLTDKLKYARNETVIVKGSGYAANENVTVDIELDEVPIVEQNVTANTLGIVNYAWQIPQDATPGTYTVSIANATTSGTAKNPPDVQEFYVEVWEAQILARNLANEPVANLTIKAYNNTLVPAQFLNLNKTTNENGTASFMLATGNYTFKAFWKQVEVSNFSSEIKNDTVLDENDWVAQLSNLKITVKDEATNEYLPFIQLQLKYNYTTEKNKNITETSHYETNFTGTVHIHNLFVNISYTVEAKRYGLSLPPIQNETIPSPWNTLTIKFPVYTTFINVVDSQNNPVEGVRVETYEWSGGLTQEKTTGSNGNTTFYLTFGRYRVRVSNGTVLLNETIVDLTQNQSFLVYLSVYNIDCTVEVVDYFGQPVPNAMVKIERKTGTKYEVTAPLGFTGRDGHVNFSGILGGDSRISIFIGGQLSGTKKLYLTNAKHIVFNLSSYVVIAGYAMETSQFVTAIALVVLVVAFIVALTHKRLLKIFIRRK